MQASDRTFVNLLLLLALPVVRCAHDAAIRQMGDHLYDQFYHQGAFQRRETVAGKP